MKLFLLVFCLFSYGNAAFSQEEVMAALQQFGYLKPAGISADSNEQEDAAVAAIKRYQAKNGLEVTGELGPEILQDLSEPRCGNPDIAELSANAKWNKSHVTYFIQKYSTDLTKHEIREAIRKALDTWSAAIPLTFEEVTTVSQADFKIGFEIGDHSDGSPFDGKGLKLGHTIWNKKILHFDDDETWVYDNTTALNGCPKRVQYRDLFTTALHELGHIIGLNHYFNDRTSIMSPKTKDSCDANGNFIRPQLADIDIGLAQTIYGTHEDPKIPVDNKQKKANTDKVTASPRQNETCFNEHHCCMTWTEHGWCQRRQSTMEVLCKASCGLCKAVNPLVDECTDRAADCREKLRTDGCDGSSSKEWMAENCRATCNLCNQLRSTGCGRNRAKTTQPPLTTTQAPETTTTRRSYKTTTAAPETPEVDEDNGCPLSIDAFVSESDHPQGVPLLFTGHHVMYRSKFHLIKDVFRGGPDTVDAAILGIADTDEPFLLLFKDRKVYGYFELHEEGSNVEYELVDGYPKELPKEVDFQIEGAFLGRRRGIINLISDEETDKSVSYSITINKVLKSESRTEHNLPTYTKNYVIKKGIRLVYRYVYTTTEIFIYRGNEEIAQNIKPISQALKTCL